MRWKARKASAYLCLLGLYTTLGASPAFAGQVRLAAATSLKDALEELKPILEKQIPGLSLTVTTGASGMLQQQIVNGAPVDIFISAAHKAMNTLQKAGMIREATRKTLVRNELLFIAPNTTSLSLRSMRDLKPESLKRIAVGEPRSVPAGDYAIQVLKYFNLHSTLSSKFVFAKDVRQVLSYVQRGEVDGGFVYASDLLSRGTGSVKVILKAPSASHEPIVYEIAEVASKGLSLSKSDEIEQTRVLLEGRDAQKIWQRYGFLEPAPKTAAQVTTRDPL